MSASAIWNACLLLLSLSSWPFTSIISQSDAAALSKPNVTLDFLQRTLNGLDLTMTFFRREHRNVNLDSVIGTRIVEATMNIVLDRLEGSGMLDDIPNTFIERITNLRDESSDISNITAPFILWNQPNYFAKIGPILRPGLFQLNYDSRDVTQKGLVWRYNPHEVMKEDESDGCLAEIFGTKSGVRCDISKRCWDTMTTPGYNGYSLSHQIFYLEIAEGFGCDLQMIALAAFNSQPPIPHFHEMFCANMLAEANLIAKANFPLSFQDLFMEQGALCGILGYRGFFQFDWLEAILSWQDKRDGCFKWDEWPVNAYEENPLKDVHRRRKREEQRVSYGCLCHRTSVAASAMALYVRFILETYLEQKGEEAL